MILYAKCWTSMTTILNNGHAQGNFAADMPAVKIQFFKVEKRCTHVQTSKVYEKYFELKTTIKLNRCYRYHHLPPKIPCPILPMCSRLPSIFSNVPKLAPPLI